MKKKIVLILLLIATSLLTTCNASTQIQNIKSSLPDNESMHIESLIPIQTQYELYDLTLNVEKHAQFEIYCDIYSYGELLGSKSVGGFRANTELNAKSIEGSIGILIDQNNIITVNLVIDGVKSYKQVDLNEYRNLEIDTLTETASFTPIDLEAENSVLFIKIFSSVSQCIAGYPEQVFDSELFREYPLYYIIRIDFME